MTRIEERERNFHLANMWTGNRKELLSMLRDYFHKLEVDDYDPKAIEKMKNVNRMMDVLEKEG